MTSIGVDCSDNGVCVCVCVRAPCVYPKYFVYACVQAFKKYEILTRKREAELMREAATRRIDLMTDDMTQVPELDVPATTEEHLTQLANVSTTDKFPCKEEKMSLKSEEVMPEESATVEQKQQAPTISPPAPKIPKLAEAAKAAVSHTADKEQREPPKEKDKPVVAAQALKKATKTDRTEETVKTRERKPVPKTKEPTKNEVQEAAKREDEEPTGNATQETTSKEELKQTKEQPVTKKEEAPTKKLEPPLEVFNGARTDKYSWSQTMTDLDVAVVVPENVTAKDLKVDIRSDHLKVTVVKPEEEVSVCVCMRVYHLSHDVVDCCTYE